MNWRGGLYRKYVLLIVALVSVTLITSSAIDIYRSWHETRRALLMLEREQARSAAIRIENFVREIEHQIGWTSLPQALEGVDPLQARRFDYVKLGRQVKAITEATFIDAQGREQLRYSRLAMDEIGKGTDRSKDPGFLAAMEGRTWFGPVYYRKDTEPYMSIALRAGLGREAGVTVVEVNLKFIWDVVQRIRVGKTGVAYVVSGDGRLVAHPDISLVLRNTDLSTLPQVKTALSPGQLSDEALLSVGETRNHAGQKVLTAWARIDALGWAVFVEQSTDEAYAPLYASIARTLAILVAGLLLSVLAGFVFARPMIGPIRRLQEGAAAIGEGRLEQKIDVHTGDELEALAEQFNAMAARLAESYAGLEKKVAERTAELQETLEQQTATSEILKVISSSPTDTRPVFEAIANSGQKLFGGSSVWVVLRDGEVIRAAAISESDPDRIARWHAAFPTPLSGEYLNATAVMERRMVDIADVEQVPRPWQPGTANFAATGYRAITIMPMLHAGEAIGAIGVARLAPGSLNPKQIALLQTFADQAVIAIENVRLFHEIENKSRQLEVANKHKSEFLANMSHELRTPLNAVIGFSEALLERMFGDLNDKQNEYLKDIHSSGRHLLSLINDILDLSKIEAGRMDLDAAAFDLPSALSNALTLVRERAQNHGVALQLEVDPHLGEIVADERKLKQILLNLLSNAVKFTPDGGRVSVSAALKSGMIEISVADTGVGIAPEDQEAVFEEFRQVGADYARKAEGTGLGLALARSFVELHGGRIWLESEPGKGSTFTFSLPTHPQEAA